MPKITMYTKDFCPYCTSAKNLLKRKGVNDILEIDITYDADLLQEMMNKSGGRRSVPQIFIGDTHVGGFSDLQSLDSADELSNLLAE
jgi:glutaredoxin 3